MKTMKMSRWVGGQYVLHKANPRPITHSRLSSVCHRLKTHGIDFIVDATKSNKYNIYIQGYRRGKFK
jgi:hypothetical protein